MHTPFKQFHQSVAHSPVITYILYANLCENHLIEYVFSSWTRQQIKNFKFGDFGTILKRENFS